MRVGIIGAGQVGSVCLLSLVMRGCAREIELMAVKIAAYKSLP